MWIEYNPNPVARINAGDCSIRAVAKALDVDWETAYAMIAANGFAMGDIISSDSVWGSVLRQHGFTKHIVPNSCPDCYTIEEFAEDNPKGTYVVGTGNHVVTIIDGNAYDSWNSLKETPIYFWTYERGWSNEGFDTERKENVQKISNDATTTNPSASASTVIPDTNSTELKVKEI